MNRIWVMGIALNIFSSVNVFAQSRPSIDLDVELPVAQWAVENVDPQYFFACSRVSNSLEIGITGQEVAGEGATSLGMFLDPVNLPSSKLGYYRYDSELALARHPGSFSNVPSIRSLAIRAFVKSRDYVRHPLGGKAFASMSPKRLDRVRAIALPSSRLSSTDLHLINPVLGEMQEGGDGFYEKTLRQEGWHTRVLRMFRRRAGEVADITLRGPFAAPAGRTDPRELWGSDTGAGTQCLCYDQQPTTLIDLNAQVPARDPYVYILFYAHAGDPIGPKNSLLGKLNRFFEKREVMAVLRIPTELTERVGSRFTYNQVDNSGDRPRLDFSVVFEIANTLPSPTKANDSAPLFQRRPSRTSGTG